jgi:AcrR family transcriptional regulator
MEGLRERKQVQQRVHIVTVGMSIFAEKGFDATTVDEIANAADVSRRTLFRYFGTKSDIVMEWARGTTSVLTEALRARPLDEKPLDSLQAAFQALNHSFTEDVRKVHATAKMVEQTPSLRPHSLLKHAHWEEALAECLRERLAKPKKPAAILLARIAVAAFRTALDEWLSGPGLELPIALTDRAFDMTRTLEM